MNKSVLITGASGGSGLTIAEHFAAQGYDVVITSRRLDSAVCAAEGVAEKYGVRAFGYELQPSGEQAVIAMFDDMRGNGISLDALVLNAADLGLNMDVFDTPIEDFSRVINTNIVWNFSIARQAAKMMRDKSKGSIVFVASNTYSQAIPDRCAYVSSKGGIVSLTKALCVDLGKYGIRVNALIPGNIKTARFDAMPKEKQSCFRSRTPIGEIADFDDLAAACLFLASDSSRNMTGAELVLDGGTSARLCPL